MNALLTLEQILTLAEKHALPDTHRITFEFVEYGLMAFVADILNAACVTSCQLKNVGGAQ